MDTPTSTAAIAPNRRPSEIRAGDRVIVHANPDGRGSRPVFGVVNLPYTRADGSPGRTIEVVLETPVAVDDGVVRCIYTTADHVLLVDSPSAELAPGVRVVDGRRLYSADWL